MSTAKKSNPALWKRIVASVKSGSKGGNAGQWSARKAQLAVQKYKSAGGGYKGEKSSENGLSKWTKQKWRTSDGSKSEGKKRYLPDAAWKALSPAERAATNKAKSEGNKSGKQFVSQPKKVAEKVKKFRSFEGGGVIDTDPPKRPNTASAKDTLNTLNGSWSQDLLKRQQFKESTFNPRAVSPAGAKGLGQIMPAVQSDAIKAGVIKPTDDIFDPKVNRRVQEWYMEDLYNSSFINKPNQSNKVRLAKTLAAYNWGRGNVANHLNAQKEAGVDIYNSLDWMDSLPVETRDYIQKILLKEISTFEEQYQSATR
jgi:hypothetical protein